MTKEEKLAKWNESSPFNVHNNIVIEDFSEGKSVVTGELNTEALNPAGMAHGGFVYSLCDRRRCGHFGKVSGAQQIHDLKQQHLFHAPFKRHQPQG